MSKVFKCNSEAEATALVAKAKHHHFATERDGLNVTTHQDFRISMSEPPKPAKEKKKAKKKRTAKKK